MKEEEAPQTDSSSSMIDGGECTEQQAIVGRMSTNARI